MSGWFLYFQAAYLAIKTYCIYVTTLFFREIEVINLENVPVKGPCIVYSNHNNQFIDGLLLTANIRRRIGFVTAAKSMRRGLIGFMLKSSQAIPVERPQDVAWKGPGTIVRVQGNKVIGQDTKFSNIRLKSTLKIGRKVEIFVKEVVSDTEIVTSDQAIEDFPINSPYKVIPKLEYNQLYQYVWQALNNQKCIGIFPEGGSHDRLELLPFKAGICIMALGAMEKYGCPVTLVPAGFNYYNPQNFRSKVILEFGAPYVVTSEIVEVYKQDKKKAIGQLLETLEKMLKSITIQCRTFDQLSMLFLCRELYTQKCKKLLSVQDKLELNRRFAKGFDKLTHEQSFKQSEKMLSKFNDFLKLNGLSIKRKKNNNLFVDILKFVVRLELCILQMLVALPGLLLMGPVTQLIVYQSEKERIKCLINSDVKKKGTDVVGSYKIFLSMIYFPIVTVFHTALVYGLLRHLTASEQSECLKYSLLVPLLMPIYAQILVKSYDSLGQSFLKLKHLFVRIFKRSVYVEFEKKKREISRMIFEMVNKYGAVVFDDFESKRILRPEEFQFSDNMIADPKTD